MIAIWQALLVWLCLSLSGAASLNAPNVPEDQMVVIPVLLLLICATASLLLALRSRRKRQITEQFGPNTLRTPYKGFEVSGLHLSSKLANEHCLKKQPLGDSRSLGLKFAATMLLAIPCVLLLSGHFGHVLASLTGSRASTPFSERASDSTGLQEVFQVYQPVSFAPEGLNGCDLDVLLMDHVFGQSYGKPFVGTRRMM